MKINKNIINAILRQDMGSFVNKAFHTINPGAKYLYNWHIDLIIDHLIEVEKGNIKRLIINMPPRALKSVVISVAWPAWLLGHAPSKRVMVASYSSVLSVKHSLDCRLIMSSKWFKSAFPTCRLSKKHNQKSKFMTTENGFRFATSVGGSATGEGGDILIIDDPHNPTQIYSEKYRNKAIDWFEQTFVTRLNDPQKGAIILVMQRLHQDDLSAHLASSNEWTTLTLPAIANKTLSYKIGEKEYIYQQDQLLNQARDSRAFLRNLESELGTKNFAAQFLQSPLPSNINLLSEEFISYYDQAPNFEFYALSWDTAIKISDQSDYSVGTCWGVKDQHYYLVSMIREKMSYPTLNSQIKKQIARYHPQYVLIEDKASGQSLIQDLHLSHYKNIIPIKPKNDKITRFASVIPIFESKRVFINKNINYRDIIHELITFPNSKHDDIIDSFSQFLNFIKTKSNNNLGSKFIRRL